MWVLLALALQVPLYEVGCLGARGDTAFIDTLAAGTWLYGDLRAERAPGKPVVLDRILVIRYPSAILEVYQCAARPWVRKVDDEPGPQAD